MCWRVRKWLNHKGTPRYTQQFGFHPTGNGERFKAKPKQDEKVRAECVRGSGPLM